MTYLTISASAKKATGLNSNNKYCIKCPYLFEEYDSNGDCTQCFDNAGTDLGECDFIKGYYFKDERCNACPTLCKTCGPVGCLIPKIMHSAALMELAAVVKITTMNRTRYAKLGQIFAVSTIVMEVVFHAFHFANSALIA